MSSAVIMCFSPHLGMEGGKGRWVCHGIGTDSRHAAFHPGQVKNNLSAFLFIPTTQTDHPTYVKHVLGNINAFLGFLAIECGEVGRVPKGLLHNLLMLFFTLGC